MTTSPVTAAPGRPQTGLRVWPGVLAGLLAVVIGAVGVWTSWRVFVATERGQLVDQAAFQGASYGRTTLWRLAEPVLEVVSVPFLALVLVAAMLIAVLRRRWGLAVQVVVLMAGANLTTQILKNYVLDRPDFDVDTVGANTLPSGHTTVAASVSATLLLVVPRRGRVWAALAGVAYTAATGVSTLIGRWHRPSDVLAGVFVVLAWTGVVAVLAALGQRASSPLSMPADDVAGRPGGPRSPLWFSAVLALAALGFGSVAGVALQATWSSADPLNGAGELTAYGGGALGVVAVTCAAFALMLLAVHLATSPSHSPPHSSGRASGWQPPV